MSTFTSKFCNKPLLYLGMALLGVGGGVGGGGGGAHLLVFLERETECGVPICSMEKKE